MFILYSNNDYYWPSVSPHAEVFNTLPSMVFPPIISSSKFSLLMEFLTTFGLILDRMLWTVCVVGILLLPSSSSCTRLLSYNYYHCLCCWCCCYVNRRAFVSWHSVSIAASAAAAAADAAATPYNHCGTFTPQPTTCLFSSVLGRFSLVVTLYNSSFRSILQQKNNAKKRRATGQRMTTQSPSYRE